MPLWASWVSRSQKFFASLRLQIKITKGSRRYFSMARSVPFVHGASCLIFLPRYSNIPGAARFPLSSTDVRSIQEPCRGTETGRPSRSVARCSIFPGPGEFSALFDFSGKGDREIDDALVFRGRARARTRHRFRRPPTHLGEYSIVHGSLSHRINAFSLAYELRRKFPDVRAFVAAKTNAPCIRYCGFEVGTGWNLRTVRFRWTQGVAEVEVLATSTSWGFWCVFLQFFV